MKTIREIIVGILKAHGCDGIKCKEIPLCSCIDGEGCTMIMGCVPARIDENGVMQPVDIDISAAGN